MIMKKTNVKQISRQPAAARAESVTKTPPIRDESATKAQPIRYAFVPLLHQFRDEHTNKNRQSQARTWIPVECSLLIRYEFAALSPQTRYAFVAILLYCGMRGIDVIPLDSKFLASALVIDERTLRKSLVELENAELLLDRQKDLKEKTEKTHRQTEPNGVCVDLNVFRNKAENENEEVFNKSDSAANGGDHLSKFSLAECLSYVQLCVAKGDAIKNPHGLAMNLFQTGKSDAFIRAAMFPEDQKQSDLETYGAPVQFSAEPCSVCFGAKMSDVDGKGYRKCERCKDEQGKSTGFLRQGESE